MHAHSPWRGSCRRLCITVVRVQVAAGPLPPGRGGGRGRGAGRGSGHPPHPRGQSPPQQQQKEQLPGKGSPYRAQGAARQNRSRSATGPQFGKAARLPWETHNPTAAEAFAQKVEPSTSASGPSRKRVTPEQQRDKKTVGKDPGANPTPRLRSSQISSGHDIASPPPAHSSGKAKTTAMAKAVAKAKTRAAAAATAEVSEGQGPSGGRPKWNPPNFPFDAVKKQGGHSYLSESLRGHERESYMAAGVLFYSFLADGRLVLLLATRERGDCATESTRGREADQWCFLGG